MANKRNLKKEINYIFEELFAEVFFNAVLFENNNPEISTILNRIENSQENLLKRISHVDGKENPKLTKQYFRKLNEDLEKEITEISEAIQTLSKK